MHYHVGPGDNDDPYCPTYGDAVAIQRMIGAEAGACPPIYACERDDCENVE